MRPLRFAIVTTDYPPYSDGDKGLSMQWLARALALRGHFVEVIHDTDYYRFRTGRLQVSPERDHGIKVHRLRGGLRHRLARIPAWLRGQPPAYASRLQEILAGRFDVIHFHDVEPIGGAALWGIGAGVKLQSLEDFWLVCPKRDLINGAGTYCSAPGCGRCLLQHGLWPRSRVADALRDPSTERAIDAFLVQSSAIRARYRAAGMGHAMHVVPPFVPGSAPLLKEAVAPVHERPFFLYDGPLVASAGVTDIVRHFSEDISADLLILGSGAETVAVRRMLRGRSNVHLLGPRPGVARQALLREALAVVVPQKETGQVPVSAIAASREGTALIAAHGGSVAEFVMQTGGGYRYQTVPELRAIFYRLAHDPRHAQSLGQRAFSGHARLWREDVSVDAYFDVIRGVAIRRGLSGLLAKLEPEVRRQA